jgi:hypothetical protein
MAEKDETESKLEKFLRKRKFEQLSPTKQLLQTKEIISEVIEFQVSGEISKPGRQRYLPVEMSDWERIERYLSNLKSVSSNLQIALGFSLNTFVASIFCLIGTSYVPDLPSFVIPLLWFLFGGSFIASVILTIFLRKNKKDFTASVELITDEMENIKKKNNSLDNG